MLVLLSSLSVWVCSSTYSHRQPFKEILGTRVHLSWDKDQGLERLSWLNHQGPVTDEQTFGNHRPATRTNSFWTMQSAGTLCNSGSISVHGKTAGQPWKLQTLIWTFTVFDAIVLTSKAPWCAKQVNWSHLGGWISRQWLLDSIYYWKFSALQPNITPIFLVKIPALLKKCLSKTPVYQSCHNVSAVTTLKDQI